MRSIFTSIMAGGALASGFDGISFASGCSGNAPVTAFANRTGEFGSTARVDVEFNCGSLTVGTAEGTTWSVTGADRNGRGPTVGARRQQKTDHVAQIAAAGVGHAVRRRGGTGGSS